MSIVVIQTAFLGDCVLTLPFLQRLCETQRSEKIILVATGPGHELFQVALQRGLKNYAERIELLRLDKRGTEAHWAGLRRFARRWPDPHTVYCLQRSFRTGFLAFLSGAPRRIGFSSGAASFFYTDLVPRSWDRGRPEIEKNLDLLRAATPTEIKAWDPQAAPSLLTGENIAAPTEPRILLSLGSPWPTKRWPLRHAIELSKKMTRAGWEVILAGDASSAALAQTLCAAVPSLLIKNYTAKTSIAEWVDLIQSSSLVVSGDSAAVHVASDLRVPVLSLFGPTLPEFGFAPWRPDSLALGVSNLPCRPCHIHGPKKCPLGHHRCLEDLTAQSVWDEVEKRFAAPRGAAANNPSA